jgi:ADP-heptose:LPS heptosyltransferase
MQLKSVLLNLLDKFLRQNRWFIFAFLDNPFIRKRFLDKYLRFRPEQFLAYYSWKPVIGNPKNILVLKTDAIGDYLLFRNYLAEIAAVYKPQGYRIVLAGNQAWKDLALMLDSAFADEFIWMDRGGMNRKPAQDKQLDFLVQINRNAYSKLLYPNLSREWEAGDWLVKHIAAKDKYAFKGNAVNQTEEQHREGNLLYHHLIEPEKGGKFDFFRNGEIVSFFTGTKNIFPAPKIEVTSLLVKEKPYAVFFPGASVESRRWPEERFAELGKLVFSQLDMKIILAGGPAEIDLCQRIADSFPAIFENRAGKTSLPQLLNLIASSDLLVSNDTSAIHMGAQCGIPSICIYKGNNFGRCMPYPEMLIPKLKVCMPASLLKMPDEERINQFSENDEGDIREILVSDIWSSILQLKEA